MNSVNFIKLKTYIALVSIISCQHILSNGTQKKNGRLCFSFKYLKHNSLPRSEKKNLVILHNWTQRKHWTTKNSTSNFTARCLGIRQKTQYFYSYSPRSCGTFLSCWRSSEIDQWLFTQGQHFNWMCGNYQTKHKIHKKTTLLSFVQQKYICIFKLQSLTSVHIHVLTIQYSNF